MNIINYFNEKKICAVIRVNDEKECLNVVNALYDGGIRIVEIILDSDSQKEIVEKFKDKEDLVIVAGGVITAREAISLMDAGVKAISSPVLQTGLIKLCHSRGVSIFCTVSTANEAYNTWLYRLPLVKIHPVTALGGSIYLKEILRTMPFLNFIAAGGIKVDEISNYISAGACGVCIGRDFYQSMDYDAIKQKAQKAVSIIENL